MIDWTQAWVIRAHPAARGEYPGLVLARGPEVAEWAELLAVDEAAEPDFCMCIGDLTFVVRDKGKRVIGEYRWHHRTRLDTGAGSRPLLDPGALVARLVQAGVMVERRSWVSVLPSELWEVRESVEIRVRADHVELAKAFAGAGWRSGAIDREFWIQGEGVFAVLARDGAETVITAMLAGAEARFRDTVRELVTD